MLQEENYCLGCGKLLTGRRAEFCSSGCGKLYRVAKKAGRSFICRQCGKPYQVTPQSAEYARGYCSALCAQKASVHKKTLTCVDCGAQFEFYGTSRKLRCDKCWSKHRSACAMAQRAMKDPNVQMGIGSGGGQNLQSGLTAEERHNLLEGRRAYYQANKEAMRAIARSRYRDKKITGRDTCEVCGYNRNQDAIVVHHIDMDRLNSSDDNLAVLCANCHMILHKLIKRRQKTEQVTSTQIYKDFKEAEVKDRNEAGTPTGESDTEGCEELQSGATHTGTSRPDMSRHEADPIEVTQLTFS